MVDKHVFSDNSYYMMLYNFLSELKIVMNENFYYSYRQCLKNFSNFIITNFFRREERR